MPQSIGGLISAQEIYLSNNTLKGSLPDKIGRLEKLRGLKVDNNLLSGEIPEEWKNPKIGKLLRCIVWMDSFASVLTTILYAIFSYAAFEQQRV